MLQTTTSNTFQERLNHLFDSKRATYRDVVDGTGGIIREAYLWQLRTGRAINPSYKVIAALASYFNVKPGYFFGEEVNSSSARLVSGLNEDERRIVHRFVLDILSQT